MDKLKRIGITTFAILICLTIMTATIPTASHVHAASKITLNKTQISIIKGNSFKLKVKGTKKKASWRSSKTSVATVNKKGKVTAKRTGRAVITAKVGKKKCKCKVIVKAKQKNKEKKISGFSASDTGVKLSVEAEGSYANWDGTSNVAQFVGSNGAYSFAYDTNKYVYVVKTKKDKIALKKAHGLFGGITCDSAGNYYLVTGRENNSTDTSKDTIFVSKYDRAGNLIGTVGDNGSSSLASYYDSSFYTQNPFDGGNCDLAINGNILTVHYARRMYSSHQSNSVFTIDTNTMQKQNISPVYQSHSFAQRVVPYQRGFVYAGEGDCFDRAFTITTVRDMDSEVTKDNIFHFWVPKGTYDKYDMWVLNDNFAHMGGLAVVDSDTVALTGTSAKALNSDAQKQSEQLFIQIFDPSQDLSTKDAYVTEGIRAGLSGGNGDEHVTDYGVKWLTNFDKNTTISNPQIASNGNGTIIVLYEKYVKGDYKGVYYMKLDGNGTIQTHGTRISNKALLNPFRMPVYAKGKICWTSNKYGDPKSKVYNYTFAIQK